MMYTVLFRSLFLLFLQLSFSLAEDGNVRKILVLHGGGCSPLGMRAAVSDIKDELGSAEYEFVYAEGGYTSGGGFLWVPDPPGGKDEPTTDPDIADLSVENLNDIVDDQGPFYGIMGYSQGAAFVAVYLSKVPVNTFEVAIMFCGYLTETHLGLLDGVNAASPFGDIPALVWMGGRDRIITNDLSLALSTKFTDPVVIIDADEGHIVPGRSEDTFSSVVDFIRSPYSGGGGGPTDPVTPSPTIVCVNDVSFVDNRGRDCDWYELEENDSKRRNKCQKNKFITACPLSCGLCCNDEPNFKFPIGNNLIPCTFIEEKEKYGLCNRMLEDGSLVEDHCARTCGNCFTSAPTSAPTMDDDKGDWWNKDDDKGDWWNKDDDKGDWWNKDDDKGDWWGKKGDKEGDKDDFWW